ncbi:ribosome maturation factor RimM [Gracilimonas mengyeensis]|uniref:Ribosome maturation factor RimM n=1 Tax=Gracilimonas mengyeensis TaxID=1302730 RepID=A0A521CVQ0_9BACT|nr:ribosome maturation factor RimM [Gracilimonas mengyeensis]SMO63516.1 16S rRNA processing protein RimM [Gracilimonas mengyeensis]
MNRDANTPGFVQVGHVVGTHGMDGELAVFFEAGELSDIEQLNLVYLRNERGDFYPARITNLRVEDKNHNISFFVQLDQIADRTAAEAVKNKGLFLETGNATAFLDPEESAEDSLMDCEVFDEQNEAIGLVVDVLENPAHPILVVATTSGSRLIPFVEHFVQEHRNGNIYCQNLDDLEGI